MATVSDDSQPFPLVFERPPLSMTVAAAARELGVSRGQMERILKAGELRCHSLLPGGERRISYAALVRYLNVREAAGL